MLMDESMENKMMQIKDKIKDATQSNDKGTTMQQAIWEMLNDFELPIPDHVKEKMQENMPSFQSDQSSSTPETEPTTVQPSLEPSNEQPTPVSEKNEEEPSNQTDMELEPVGVSLETAESDEQANEPNNEPNEEHDNGMQPMQDYHYRDEPEVSLSWTNPKAKRKKRKKRKKRHKRK